MITGQRGAGKSTLLAALTGGSAQDPEKNSIWAPGTAEVQDPEKNSAWEQGIGASVLSGDYGFSTHLIPEDRVELFLHLPMADTGPHIIGRCMPGEGTNRMKPDKEMLDHLAGMIRNASALENDRFFVIDEIGYLENASPDFCETVFWLFDTQSVIAAVRKERTALIDEILSREDILLIDLDAPFGEPGCVIMASGLGTRFGENKLMAALNGQPLIRYILSAIRPVFRHSIVVTRHTAVQEYCRACQQAVILHALPHRNDTTRLGVSFLREKPVECIIFFQGDQPFVTTDTIMTMLLTAKNCSGKIVRLAYKGTDRSPVLFPADCFDDLMKLPEGKGGNYLARLQPERVISIEALSETEIVDIDTPEDMKRFDGKIIWDRCGTGGSGAAHAEGYQNNTGM